MTLATPLDAASATPVAPVHLRQVLHVPMKLIRGCLEAGDDRD